MYLICFWTSGHTITERKHKDIGTQTDPIEIRDEDTSSDLWPEDLYRDEETPEPVDFDQSINGFTGLGSSSKRPTLEQVIHAQSAAKAAKAPKSTPTFFLACHRRRPFNSNDE